MLNDRGIRPSFVRLFKTKTVRVMGFVVPLLVGGGKLAWDIGKGGAGEVLGALLSDWLGIGSDKEKKPDAPVASAPTAPPAPAPVAPAPTPPAPAPAAAPVERAPVPPPPAPAPKVAKAPRRAPTRQVNENFEHWGWATVVGSADTLEELLPTRSALERIGTGCGLEQPVHLVVGRLGDGAPSFLSMFEGETTLDDARDLRECFKSSKDVWGHAPIVAQWKYAIMEAGEPKVLNATLAEPALEPGDQVLVAPRTDCPSCEHAVPVRKEPAADAEPVATFMRGDGVPLTVLGTYSDPKVGAWVKVRIDATHSGWIYWKNVRLVES